MQELQDGVRLGLAELGEPGAVGRVDVERLQTGDRVGADRGVVGVDWGPVGLVSEIVLCSRVSVLAQMGKCGRLQA